MYLVVKSFHRQEDIDDFPRNVLFFYRYPTTRSGIIFQSLI